MTQNNLRARIHMTLPLDTTKYAAAPLGIIICKPIKNADGSLRDYRIIFGNEPFKRLTGKTNFIGMLVSELTDNRKFMKTQLEDVPEPYVGFAVISIAEDEKKITRKQFLKTIRQMEGAAVLLREKSYAKFEAVFVSKGFAKLMRCNVEEALSNLNQHGVIAFMHADDRLAVKRMLRRRTSEDSTKDLTIRLVTAKDEVIWCNVNYTFIDDFGEHYVYCTFFDVTNLHEHRRQFLSRKRTDAFNVKGKLDKKQSGGCSRARLVRDGFGDTPLFRADKVAGKKLSDRGRAKFIRRNV